jgi:hypothetical protein
VLTVHQYKRYPKCRAGSRNLECKLKDNIKIDLRAVRNEDVDSIHVVHDTPSRWRVHLQRLYSAYWNECTITSMK